MTPPLIYVTLIFRLIYAGLSFVSYCFASWVLLNLCLTSESTNITRLKISISLKTYSNFRSSLIRKIDNSSHNKTGHFAFNDID